MGEKPLSIDEAPVRTATVGGVGSTGGFDPPPPDVSGAAGIITTRSNIKHASGVTTAGEAGAVASDPTRPGGPGPTDPGDPLPEEETAELQESGKRGWYRSSAAGTESEAAGAAADGEPIPGIDTKGRRNPGGAAATVGPVKPEPTRPADPIPTDAGPAGIAIKEQGVKYGEDAGDTTATTDAPGVAGGSQPIPGVDIIVTKNPPR